MIVLDLRKKIVEKGRSSNFFMFLIFLLFFFLNFIFMYFLYFKLSFTLSRLLFLSLKIGRAFYLTSCV